MTIVGYTSSAGVGVQIRMPTEEGMGGSAQWRWLVPCLVSLVCFAAWGSAADETDCEKAGLHGPVKSVITEVAGVSQSFDAWVEGRRHTASTTFYDAAGWKTQEQEFSEAGSVETRKVYAYGTSGKLAECQEYTANGLLARATRYEYDSAGDCCGYTIYTASGATDTRAIYELDTAGRRTAMDIYDSAGKLTDHWTHLLDAAGHILETCMWGSDGVLTGRITSEYDVSGRQTGVVIYVYNNGELMGTQTTTKDENGNDAYLAYSWNPPFSSLLPNSTYTYVLDEQGNWTKQTTYQEVTKFGQTYWEPKTVTYRTILYY